MKKKKTFSKAYLARTKKLIQKDFNERGVAGLHLLTKKDQKFVSCITIDDMRSYDQLKKHFDIIGCGCGG